MSREDSRAALPATARPAPVEMRPPAGSKITPRHLAQRALIYVRQSSVTQVQRYPESARRQYGLTERAQRLGWEPAQITVIDDDQGKSAAGSAAEHGRDGFAQVVSAVGLGEVGLLLALEVARLARNSAEWYRLLELAALAGVLIGDEDTIYDPRDFNDRLLLGLRGTISEVELHWIKARLYGARMSKARRGELPLTLPAGYARGPDGQVEFDPDEEVQGALRAVFTQFERLGSASAVLRFFRAHGLRLPRRYGRGPGLRSLVWVKPSYEAIHQVLTNPAYAGAYAYGQRRQEDTGVPALGRGGPRRRWALDQLEVLVRDHHPAYVSWDRYLSTRALLRDNGRQFATSRGAPQPGQGLLQGIIVCGRCGCRMWVHHSVSSPSYVCGQRQMRYGEPRCQSLSIAHVDAAVSAAFLAVIRPAELEASLALADDLARDQAQVARQWQLRLERARYEADRAHRQYDAVEPENRLVARELERRWNETLRLVTELEAEYRSEQERGLSPLTETEKAELRALVSNAPALWQAPETTMEERKRLLRCLVSAVIVRRDDAPRNAGGQTTVCIGWRSGTQTTVQARRPSSTEGLGTPAALLERIRLLARQESDARIAEILTAEGWRTRWDRPWTARRVQSVRHYQHIPTASPTAPSAVR